MNDYIVDTALIFMVVVVLGVVGIALLDTAFNRLVGWAVLSGFKKQAQSKQKNDTKKVTAAELIDRGDAYVKKGQLLTEPEKILFKVLQSKYGLTHHVFAQVRVVDVIQPNAELYEEGSREWLALFRQVSQWHFDFVICEKDTMEVVRVIELDDASHKRISRIRRDKILNWVCNDADINVERIGLNIFLAKIKRCKAWVELGGGKVKIYIASAKVNG